MGWLTNCNLFLLNEKKPGNFLISWCMILRTVTPLVITNKLQKKTVVIPDILHDDQVIRVSHLVVIAGFTDNAKIKQTSFKSTRDG